MSLLLLNVARLFLFLAVMATECMAEAPVIDAAVAQAKREGKNSIVIAHETGNPVALRSLAQLPPGTSLLVVTAQGAVPMLEPRRNYIVTWYKFSIDEDLSTQPIPRDVPVDHHVDEVPPSLLPLSGDEALLKNIGGELSIDGVTVKYGQAKPLLIPGHKYLLLAGSADLAGHIFVLAGGAKHAFQIADDGDTLIPIVPDSDSSIYVDASRTYHNSLGSIRAARRAQ
jgi:hypothetical protein